nr:MAG TPA: hypothetical protein [Caudoviricetes sp.]
MFSIISTFFSRYISMTKLTPPHKVRLLAPKRRLGCLINQVYKDN